MSKLAAYGDTRGVELARAIVRGQLGNQAALLKYFGKYQKQSAPDTFADLAKSVRAIGNLRRDVDTVTGERIDDLRSSLLAIEGAAGRHYWSGVRALLEGYVAFGTSTNDGGGRLVGVLRRSGTLGSENGETDGLARGMMRP